MLHYLLTLTFCLCSFGLYADCEHDLIDLRSVNDSIQIDMRYASCNNPLGYPIYPSNACYVVAEVAEKLGRVQEELAKRGYGIKVFDAYRPYRLQAYFAWQPGPDAFETFCHLTDRYGSCRGTAVDVTLVCLSGYSLPMPIGYDVNEASTAGTRPCLLPNVYHNYQMLEQMMSRFGFIPSQTEWWHFDYASFGCYPLLDVSFDEL